jgi:hypothetical protein
MAPTLPAECEIEVIPLSAQTPLGALVVFVADDALISHRLVRRAGGRWVTHGDGRLAADPPLSPGQILGVVAAAYRDGQRCWPGRGERGLAWAWIVRHHALRPLHWVWRWLRRPCG